MMEKTKITLTELFSEDKGRISLMRIMCFVALLNAMGAYWLAKDITATSLFIGAAFGSKAAQKIFEGKGPKCLDDQPNL